MNILRSRSFRTPPWLLLRMTKKHGYKNGAIQSDFRLPKKGTPERIALQNKMLQQKREHERKDEDDRDTPPFAAALFVAWGLPQTFALYSMIWNDTLSDNFFLMFDVTYGWLALLATFEGAAGCGLGYWDYLSKQSDETEKLWIRKKRLAFMKFSFIMSSVGLFYLNTPTPHWVLPLMVATLWNTFKSGTQSSYELLPKSFFLSRTFLNIYNVLILGVLWWKVRKARKEKLELEFEFFQRVEGLIIRSEIPELAI